MQQARERLVSVTGNELNDIYYDLAARYIVQNKLPLESITGYFPVYTNIFQQKTITRSAQYTIAQINNFFKDLRLKASDLGITAEYLNKMLKQRSPLDLKFFIDSLNMKDTISFSPTQLTEQERTKFYNLMQQQLKQRISVCLEVAAYV